MPFDTDQLPRIAVDQAPKTGHIYPFSDESDLAGLIQDLYLSYAPLDAQTKAEENTAQYVYPLRISRLKLPIVEGDLTWEEISVLWEEWGNNWEAPFSGSVVRVAPIVVDDNDVVVFDPAGEGARYHAVPWGSDRLIVEWIGEGKVMRLVVTPAGLVDVEDDYTPTSAFLDPRTYQQLNSGVQSLAAGGEFATPVFKIRAGNNMRIDVTPSPAIEGTRRKTRLSFNAIAGAGLGKTPGCEGDIDYLTSINNQVPDDSGRLFLFNDDCYRIQVPVSIAAGVANVTPNALKFFSSCNQVCPPIYYVNVYKGLSKLWDRWQDIADELALARDQYVLDLQRWNDQRDCRRNNPAKLMVTAEPNCRIAVSAVYCNAGKTCLIPLEMRFKFETLSGLPTATPTQCGPAYRKNSSLAIEEAVAMLGAYPTWYTKFDYADPQSISMVRFRICIPGCSGKQVRVTMTVGSPDTGDDQEAVVQGGPLNGSIYDTRATLVQTIPMTASPPAGGGMCAC